MKKNVVIVVIFLIIIVFGGYLFLNYYNAENRQIDDTQDDIKCQIAADCAYYWTAYSEDNPCSSCFKSSSDWICLNKDEANKKTENTLEDMAKTIGLVSCERCEETDDNLYECQCQNSKCIKQEIK